MARSGAGSLPAVGLLGRAALPPARDGRASIVQGSGRPVGARSAGRRARTGAMVGTVPGRRTDAACRNGAAVQPEHRRRRCGLCAGAGRGPPTARRAVAVGQPVGWRYANRGRRRNRSGFSTQASLGVDWAPDLWGRLQSSVNSAQANAQASEADLASARLSAVGALASAYFQLREADAEIELLLATVEGYERSLQIVRNRYAAGVVAQTDVLQAQTSWRTRGRIWRTVRQNRSRFEHAMAVLTGRAPRIFRWPSAQWQAKGARYSGGGSLHAAAAQARHRGGESVRWLRPTRRSGSSVPPISPASAWAHPWAAVAAAWPICSRCRARCGLWDSRLRKPFSMLGP